MTCRDVEKQLDLFLDGELEARAMRAVALHATRCTSCEAALQRLERVQDVVGESFTDAVAGVDFSTFWPAVAARAERPRRSFAGVLAALRTPARLRAARPLLAAAATLAAVWIAAGLWRGAVAPTVERIARANNQARIDSLASEAPSVALVSEPVTNTTVIWVVDDGGVQ